MSERLNEAAVERVVRRAIELDDDVDDTGASVRGLDVAAVVAAAEELGISRDAVLESVALERLGDTPPTSALDPMFGARWVMAQRRVGENADAAFDRLDQWLTKSHRLRREQRHGTSAVWHRRRDMAASLQRGVRGFSGGARLGTVTIIGHVAPIDDGTSLVRVTIDRSPSRSRHVGVATAGGVSGAAAAVGLATTVTPPLALAGLPFVAVSGVAAKRSKRSTDAFALELNRLLDQLAAGEEPGTSIGRRLPRRRR